MKAFWVAVVWTRLLFCGYAAVSITNVTASQRPGTKLVDIAYDLLSDGTNPVNISVSITASNQLINATTLSGDVGSQILPGTNKAIAWNMGIDWAENSDVLDITLILDNGTGADVAPCKPAQTGQKTSYKVMDDGYLRKGVDWPAVRFAETIDGTIVDNLTGLEWVKSPQLLPGNSNRMGWTNALDLCNGLNFAGHADWRLPNIRELLSLLDYEYTNPTLPRDAEFTGLGTYFYWSSTTSYSESMAWGVTHLYGYTQSGLKSSTFFVWPVRTSSASGVAPLPKTGQRTSYYPGDDGDLQAGKEWPTPRFVERNGLTVIDRLTGLEWVKAPHALDGNSTGVAWSNAVTFCADLSYANHLDWRLPNTRELQSLVDYGQSFPAYSQIFPLTIITNGYYWSSTTSAQITNRAWSTSFNTGTTDYKDKYYMQLVLPVRQGQYSFEFSENQNLFADARDYTVEISSIYGHPNPQNGINSNYCWRSTVDCLVDAAIETNGTNYICDGWIGTGSVPSLGTGNRTEAIILTNLYSSIIWNWVSALPDSDGDGMKDVWESDNFGTLARSAVDDDDHDGQSNQQEYMFGTSPTNALSIFDFQGAHTAAGGFRLDFPTIQSRYYTVEYRGSLTDGQWQPLTGFSGTGSPVFIIDSLPPAARFYRVNVEVE